MVKRMDQKDALAKFKRGLFNNIKNCYKSPTVRCYVCAKNSEPRKTSLLGHLSLDEHHDHGNSLCLCGLRFPFQTYPQKAEYFRHVYRCVMKRDISTNMRKIYDFLTIGTTIRDPMITTPETSMTSGIGSAIDSFDEDSIQSRNSVQSAGSGSSFRFTETKNHASFTDDEKTIDNSRISVLSSTTSTITAAVATTNTVTTTSTATTTAQLATLSSALQSMIKSPKNQKETPCTASPTIVLPKEQTKAVSTNETIETTGKTLNVTSSTKILEEPPPTNVEIRTKEEITTVTSGLVIVPTSAETTITSGTETIPTGGTISIDERPTTTTAATTATTTNITTTATTGEIDARNTRIASACTIATRPSSTTTTTTTTTASDRESRNNTVTTGCKRVFSNVGQTAEEGQTEGPTTKRKKKATVSSETKQQQLEPTNEPPIRVIKYKRRRNKAENALRVAFVRFATDYIDVCQERTKTYCSLCMKLIPLANLFSHSAKHFSRNLDAKICIKCNRYFFFVSGESLLRVQYYRHTMECLTNAPIRRKSNDYWYERFQQLVVRHRQMYVHDECFDVKFSRSYDELRDGLDSLPSATFYRDYIECYVMPRLYKQINDNPCDPEKIVTLATADGGGSGRDKRRFVRDVVVNGDTTDNASSHRLSRHRRHDDKNDDCVYSDDDLPATNDEESRVEYERFGNCYTCRPYARKRDAEVVEPLLDRFGRNEQFLARSKPAWLCDAVQPRYVNGDDCLDENACGMTEWLIALSSLVSNIVATKANDRPTVRRSSVENDNNNRNNDATDDDNEIIGETRETSDQEQIMMCDKRASTTETPVLFQSSTTTRTPASSTMTSVVFCHVYVYEQSIERALRELFDNPDKYYVLPNTCLCYDSTKSLTAPDNVHRHMIVAFRNQAARVRYVRKISYNSDRSNKSTKRKTQYCLQIKNKRHFFYAVRYVSREKMHFNSKLRESVKKHSRYDESRDEQKIHVSLPSVLQDIEMTGLNKPRLPFGMDDTLNHFTEYIDNLYSSDKSPRKTRQLLDNDTDDDDHTAAVDGYDMNAASNLYKHSETNVHVYISKPVCSKFKYLTAIAYETGLDDLLMYSTLSDRLHFQLCTESRPAILTLRNVRIESLVVNFGSIRTAINANVYEHLIPYRDMENLSRSGIDRITERLRARGVRITSAIANGNVPRVFADYENAMVRLPPVMTRRIARDRVIYDRMVRTIYDQRRMIREQAMAIEYLRERCVCTATNTDVRKNKQQKRPRTTTSNYREAKRLKRDDNGDRSDCEVDKNLHRNDIDEDDDRCDDSCDDESENTSEENNASRSNANTLDKSGNDREKDGKSANDDTDNSMDTFDNLL